MHRSPPEVRTAHRPGAGSARSSRAWLFVATLVLCRPAAAVECVPDGTTVERGLCATQEAVIALNAVDAALAEARARHPGDPIALTALDHAHQAWQRYREAALAAAFPCYHDDLSVCFTADTPKAYAELETRLAREWTAHLERF